MSHVFISYSKKNKDYARRLADFLLDHGFDIWIDDRIDFGENWLETMFHAVVECAAFVVIMTPEARESRWVQREVAWADEREKKFFPLLLDGDNWPVFVLTQYADIRDGSLPDSAFLKRLGTFAPFRAEQGIRVTPQSKRKPTKRPEPSISPEVQRLLDMMLNPQIAPVERAEAGQKLAKLGDPRRGVGLRPDGLPDIDWVEIPAGDFTYSGDERLTLPTFYIARYPITYIQFQAFLDAPDGYERNEWWAELTPENQKQPMAEQYFKYYNPPREMVTWYEAVAFCQWLSARLGYDVSLPTEVQWEKAAQGTDGREYPWGDGYISGYANVNEVKSRAGLHYLQRTSAVGIYPQGASPYGVLDMGGNVWEWCVNTPEGDIELDGEVSRVLRGGSWNAFPDEAICAIRNWGNPDNWHYDRGFRVVCSAPIP